MENFRLIFISFRKRVDSNREPRATTFYFGFWFFRIYIFHINGCLCVYERCARLPITVINITSETLCEKRYRWARKSVIKGYTPVYSINYRFRKFYYSPCKQLWKMVKNGRLEVRCCAHPLLLSLSLCLCPLFSFSHSLSLTQNSLWFFICNQFIWNFMKSVKLLNTRNTSIHMHCKSSKAFNYGS